MTTENTPDHPLGDVWPGDILKIEGRKYSVRSISEEVNPSNGLQAIILDEPVGPNPPPTRGSPSCLRVDCSPYEWEILNRPDQEVNPEDVEHLG